MYIVPNLRQSLIRFSHFSHANARHSIRVYNTGYLFILKFNLLFIQLFAYVLFQRCGVIFYVCFIVYRIIERDNNKKKKYTIILYTAHLEFGLIL